MNNNTDNHTDNLINSLVNNVVDDEPSRKTQAWGYMVAGNSTFTIESTKINKRYTYKVVHKKTDSNPDRLLIYCMHGSENDKASSYHYIGLMYRDTGHMTFNQPSSGPAHNISMFRSFVKIILSDYPWPETCHFYQSGRCACCGRKLTTPESIERGIGPECWERIQKQETGL